MLILTQIIFSFHFLSSVNYKKYVQIDRIRLRLNLIRLRTGFSAFSFSKTFVVSTLICLFSARFSRDGLELVGIQKKEKMLRGINSCYSKYWTIRKRLSLSPPMAQYS